MAIKPDYELVIEAIDNGVWHDGPWENGKRCCVEILETSLCGLTTLHVDKVLEWQDEGIDWAYLYQQFRRHIELELIDIAKREVYVSEMNK